jgi:ergothioneine biosynthesis protein EgtB
MEPASHALTEALAAPSPARAFDSALSSVRQARARTDELWTVVGDAWLHERPVPERHRLVFYLGHLEAFDWNLIGHDTLGRGAHDLELDPLFAFGIDPTSASAFPTDDAADWPTVERTRRYARSARRHLDAALSAAVLLRRVDGELAWRLAAAAEHRLMHAETLCYLLHALPLEAKRRPCAEPPVRARSSGFGLAARRRVLVPEGAITLGRERKPESDFGWDVEFGSARVTVPAFEIDALPVTNGEYARFVEQGGYLQRDFWDEEGWRWRSARDARHPWSWSGRPGRWRWRGMFEERALPPDLPVHVSHAEASAYARWSGAALPSEAQWQRAARGTPDGSERAHPWGDHAPILAHANLGCSTFDPMPVGSHPHGASAFGVEDLVGDGWEWTRTPLAPLPGYAPQPFYPGYSAPFFDGRHFVLQGASHRTARSLVRASFRNWFQPHFPHVYAKFRCVTD